MAETLIRPRLLGTALLLWLAQACSHAQALQDPTRPATLSPAAEGSEGAAGPQLQSVLIARQPGGRHVAVIDGETVRQGEMYKDARVVRITPNAVELSRGKERQVLRLSADDEPGAGVQRTGRLQ